MSVRLVIATLFIAALTSGAAAQSGLPDISGTWEAESPDGPVSIIVRTDSSASFGDEIVRWRLAPDTVYLALGGEWIAYNFRLKGKTLTLSGGDLEEPIDLKKIGPATPRPTDVPVPPVPTEPGG
jgi:hypothetical protein